MNINSLARRLTILLLLTTAFSCSTKKEESKSSESLVRVPPFNADSAYALVSKQVSFGPRIPNSKSHRATGDFIISTLKRYGARIRVQEFQATTFDGQKLALRNIIASYYVNRPNRILLAAHWDTRPFADKDSASPNAPFDGANDGASGVAVLLEIARHLDQDSVKNAGIDLIFFDGEDWGEKNNTASPATLPENLDSWWCLGSQYWSSHQHTANYNANYGILLDMVGATDARFFKEGNSVAHAPRIVEKVWSTAARLGYSTVFVNQNEGAITDDHVFVIDRANIPMIDIAQFEPGVGYFGKFHHTRQDNLSSISKETLGIVGKVVMQVIYYED